MPKRIKSRRSTSQWIIDKNPIKYGIFSKLKKLPRLYIVTDEYGSFEPKEFYLDQNSGHPAQEMEGSHND
jgi:hypothetical protein